jgi:hypothetical protein
MNFQESDDRNFSELDTLTLTVTHTTQHACWLQRSIAEQVAQHVAMMLSMLLRTAEAPRIRDVS